MERVVRVTSLAKVDWPVGAVFVVDKDLDLPLPLDEPIARVEAGEELKSLGRIETLAERVLSLRSTRPLTLVAIGGGSVTDAVGFLASVLWRGVELWNVPTTLLGAADAAFGGKTAINLGANKNQLGTFWRAHTVVLVDELLAALPTSQRADGLAEIVKTLWLAGRGLDILDRGVDRLAFAPWSEVEGDISVLLDETIRTKCAITDEDPREESGLRTLLNFGHTIGHAIERRHRLSHGRAVAWGLAAAASLSVDLAGLPPEDAERMWRHLRPLLGARPPRMSVDALTSAMRADKRHRGGKLGSVLLRSPGDAFVTYDPAPTQWHGALAHVVAKAASPLEIRLPRVTPCVVEVPTSKSELARMLVISHLRAGATTIRGASNAGDVTQLIEALALMGAGAATIEVGDGAAPFRFLCAVAAATRTKTRLVPGPQLAARPHEPLFVALRSAGATVKRHGDTWEIGQLPPGPLRFEVDASTSSQFASALALLAASGREVTLALSGAPVSAGYFELTLSLLEECGVSVGRFDGGVELGPTPRLRDPVELVPAPDASCLAVWRAARWLGLAVETADTATPRQPDGRIDEMWWDSKAASEQIVEIGGTPDLACVMAAAAALTPAPVRFVGAPHLRHKESDRIESLCRAFGAVGVDVRPLPDGIAVPEGAQRPRGDRVFPTHGDHRLAMAACLLATRGAVTIDDPTVVAKSYPSFWEDAMRAGFRLTDRSGRSPDT